MHDKSIANIILNREQLILFPIKSGMRQGCLLSLLLFNIVLDFLARVIRQKQEIKWIQIGKEDVKLFLLADDMILYLSDPKNSTKIQLEIINSFRIVAGYKVNIQKSVVFLYTDNKNTQQEIRKTILNSLKTNKLPCNKFSEGNQRPF
jgi:hypothetical protein